MSRADALRILGFMGVAFLVIGIVLVAAAIALGG